MHILGAQSRAVLVAARFENASSSFGGHSLNKAVLFGTLALFWLKCSLWHNPYYSNASGVKTQG
jgi:hypothetical protein